MNELLSGMERSVVKKGAAAVDGLCPIANTSHVYCEQNDKWDCMLNQVSLLEICIYFTSFNKGNIC